MPRASLVAPPPGTVRMLDDRVRDVPPCRRLGIRIEHLDAQSIGHDIGESPRVDEDALVGEARQEAATFGEPMRRVQRDRFPDPLDVGVRDTVLPQHRGREVGSLDLEATLAAGVLAEPQIVHHRGGEEQFLVVLRVVQAALALGEQAREQEGPDAVVRDRAALRGRTSARLASASGPVGSARISFMPGP